MRCFVVVGLIWARVGNLVLQCGCCSVSLDASTAFSCIVADTDDPEILVEG